MSAFSGVSAADLERTLRDAEQRGIRMREFTTQVAQLVGEGEAADGHVWVSWTAGEGLAEVQIDPRAMRLSAEELGAAIKAAVREAIADLRDQVQDLMAEVLGEGRRQDARDRLDQARQAFDSRIGQVLAELERARRTLPWR